MPEAGLFEHATGGWIRVDDVRVDAMQIQIVKSVTNHFACRVCADTAPMLGAIAEQDVIFRMLVHRIDADQARQADELGLIIGADRAPDVRAAPLEVRLEPAL